MPTVSICIDVPDLARATAFYRDALGCSLVREEPTHNTLSADGVTVYLSLQESGSVATRTAKAVRSYERHWTPVHLDFAVDDVAATVERVLAAGGTQEGEKSGDWGEAAFCADPFGNGFCLMRLA